MLLKLALVPALIAGITLAGRQWGPGIAGWLSGFPIVAGPILLFVALERGSPFAAATAAAALAGGLAWLSFALSYAWAATRLSWLPAMLISLAVYLVIGVAVVLAAPSLWLVAACVVIAVVLAPRLFPPVKLHAARVNASSAELFARMVAGGVLTVAVTRLSPALGPGFSGLFAVFPVMGIVLAAFSHRASGAMFTIRLLRSMAFGFFSFTAFCIALTLALRTMPIAASFALALGCSLTVHCLVLWGMRRAWQRVAGPDPDKGSKHA